MRDSARQETAAFGTTAWNGLVLRHPTTWEVTRLDRDQLVWSEEHRAVLEIRWALHKGRFDPQRHFKRFARQARRKALPQPESWQIPESWQLALAQFKVSGFKWRRNDEVGFGLLVYCPHCRRLSLVQIHPALADQSCLIPSLLTTFRDHPDREELPISIFGIRARLPLGSRLTDFRFETGQYRMRWFKGRHCIGLYRWMPAGVVLARQPLLAFANDFFQLSVKGRPDAGVSHLDHNDYESVGGRWEWALGPQALSSWLAPRLKRRYIRVWHVPAHNCLMGVELSGRGRGLSPMFERLCHEFEVHSIA